MGLSEEQKERLEIHYAYWGIDEVRRQLERDGRDQFADPDVTAYAREWIETAEKELRHRQENRVIQLFVGSVFAGVALALLVSL